MEDNLHKKLKESEELYGDYKMPHDALENFRQYESKRTQTSKKGGYKYLSFFLIVAFTVSNAYWINNSVKTKEKLTVDTNKASSNVPDQEKEFSSNLLKEYSNQKSTKEDTKVNSKTSSINNSNLSKKENVSKKDLTIQKNDELSISESDNHGKDTENLIKSSTQPKVNNKYKRTEKSHTPFTTVNRVSRIITKEKINPDTATDKTKNPIKFEQTNVQAKELSPEEVSYEKLQLSKLVARPIETVSSIKKQKTLSSLSVRSFQKTIPNKPKLNHRYSLGLNYSWVSQTTNNYPQLSGNRLGIEGGMAVTNRLRTRINLSLLHQDGKIKDLNDVSLYGLDEPEIPAGALFERLDFDRYAFGATLGLDYYFDNFEKIRPFIGGHYHLEASQINDIKNYYRSAASENVNIILQNGKLRFNNYLGLMTGVEMAVWRNYSLSLELQYFQSLSKRENSFYSIGIGTSYRF